MDSIDEQIRRAMEAGQFDNLPGKGKPLKLNTNPFEDPEWRMANHVLRNGGFSLPWIETRREIEKELTEARVMLGRAWNWRRGAAGQASPAWIQSEWERAAGTFRQRIADLNKRIQSYNLQAPRAQFQLTLLDADHEIAATTSGAAGEELR